MRTSLQGAHQKLRIFEQHVTGATPTALRETVREFAPSKSAKMGNFGFKEPWKILAFGKCRRKRLSYQCFQSFEFPDTLTALRGRANPFDVPV
jgi:hypothetical protein